MNYGLFSSFADRYDLHTPPEHYRHDHELVLELAAHYGLSARLLDIGCGTGVLVGKALQAGYSAVGLDISREMISVARKTVPYDAVRVQRMQNLDEHRKYDLVVSLSWCIHYCSNENEVLDVLRSIWCSLRSSGRMLLQIAHGPNLPTQWIEDLEAGPNGQSDDVSLRYRFRADAVVSGRTLADYEYSCKSTLETLSETHVLEVTNAVVVGGIASVAGFVDVEIWDSFKRDRFASNGSVFLTALKSE